MKTSADPTGTKVLGTSYNCSGGVTPWGTVLTCEEGVSDIFGGDPQGDADRRHLSSATASTARTSMAAPASTTAST